MPVAWTTVALASLNDYLVAAQLTAINTAALAVGQTDRFTNIASNIVTRIRNAIETGGMQISATAATIPPELKWAACYIILGQLQTSIPSLRLTEDQKAQIERAESELQRIAEGKLKVSEPTDPLDPPNVQGGAGASLIRSGGQTVADAGFGQLGTS